ncbi:MAG TPA: replication-associated recombination protein A [Candidatus Saccharimonadales bacterium]|nr:replication-associated recombination protein A [Candidatus Saccharimonadales bacterium]
MEKPLPERMRPRKLDDVVGQDHLTGKGKLFGVIVERKQPVNLILWGPPGSGKTTIARILAHETGADFTELSAVSTGKADIREVVKRAMENQAQGKPTIVFVDEIHRFNKAQQDIFLPYVEGGLLTLIGATTENPSFEVIGPLLSRSRVVVLNPHSADDLRKIIANAIKAEKSTSRVSKEATEMLVGLADGDARVALSNLELALQTTKGKITPEIIQTVAQKRSPHYDKNGEAHYNIISAFIKSMRGGDPTAATYYMARMLQAGEDPKFIARRMVIFASEDIGLAGNGAVSLAVSTFLAVERVGLPECQFSLFHCAIALTKAKKSREVTKVMGKALKAAEEYPDAQVPLHLRNAPTKLMKDLGYNQGYEWSAGFEHEKGFLPNELKSLDFFR